MPFSASPFLASSTFPFSFLFGRNPVLPFWKSFVIILLPCPGSPRPFLSMPWEVARVLFCFCFLFSSSVFFYRAVPVFLFFFVPEGIRAYWWFLRILASYTLLWSSFSFGCFFFWASGSSGPFFYSLCIYYFGLSSNFPFGLDLFFLGLFHYDPF